MRPVTFQRNYVKHPAGSCLVSFGETRVLCTASIEKEVPPHRRGSGGGWLGAEYSMLPGSTSPRKRRDTSKPDGRSVEIQRLVGRSLRAAVDLDSLGEVSIQIDCDVLQADGGTRTAAITGGYVALYDALTVLAAKNNVAAGPAKYLLGQVAAVSVGMVAGQLVVDLDYERDSKAEVDMNVVMRMAPNGSPAFIEVQGTGEHGVFDRTALDRMLDGAQGAITELFAAQRKALGV